MRLIFNSNQETSAGRFARWLIGSLLLFVLASSIFWGMGYRINLTASLPIGIWKIKPLPRGSTLKDLKGKYILFHPPNTPFFKEAKKRGYVGFGLNKNFIRPLLKQVVGVPGDVIIVKPEGVFINGEFLPNSAPKPVDGEGREMPVANSIVLRPGELWIMSTYSAGSFDSRYFGKIQLVERQGSNPAFLTITGR